MNNEIIAVIIRISLKNIFSLLIKKLIVSHFGKNPRKGGSPPKDKKFNIKIIFIVLLDLIIVIWCKNIVFIILNVKTIMIEIAV